jgi:DNA-binding IclR family transcriptional regulator
VKQNTQVVSPAYPLQSVDRAFTLVAMLREGDLRVVDAAERLGVAQSTAHRLLAMLVHHDYAVQLRQHIYTAGPALAAGIDRARQPPNLVQVARPHIAELSAQTGETVHVMVLEGTGARFVDGVESAQNLKVSTRVGMVLPAHITSGGKALLARLSLEELLRLYPRGLRLTPDAAGPDIVSLERELGTIRRRGYAVNLEETEQRINAIGAAVVTDRGRGVAAVVVAAPSVRVPKRALGALSEPLLATVSSIGAEIWV